MRQHWVEFLFPTGHVSCATQKSAEAATESAFKSAQEGIGANRPSAPATR
jgi:hypothetical protein